MNYTSFQSGILVKRSTAKGFTWILRYTKDGKRKALILGKSDELPTEKDAKRKMSTMVTVINESKIVYTFGQLVERYIDEEIPSRPQTASSYKSNIKYLMAQYGDMKLEAMLKDLMSIQTWLGDLKTSPKGLSYKAGPAPRPLSKKTKQNIKATLHRIIECAMRWGYLPVERNPIGLVEVKVKGIQPAKRLKHPLTMEQIHKLLEYKELSAHVKTMIQLCVYLGLRISEVLGLKWEDIDFDNRVIHIQRGAVGSHIDETKSETSNSVLPIHQHVVDLLKAWSLAQPVVNGWVFGSIATGRPFHRDSLQQDHLLPAGVACGLTNLGWHTFRHTHINLLRQNGAPEAVQMMLMRHADMRTTNGYGVDDGSLEIKRPAHEALVDSILNGGK